MYYRRLYSQYFPHSLPSLPLLSSLPIPPDIYFLTLTFHEPSTPSQRLLYPPLYPNNPYSCRCVKCFFHQNANSDHGAREIFDTPCGTFASTVRRLVHDVALLRRIMGDLRSSFKNMTRVYLICPLSIILLLPRSSLSYQINKTLS